MNNELGQVVLLLDEASQQFSLGQLDHAATLLNEAAVVLEGLTAVMLEDLAAAGATDQPGPEQKAFAKAAAA